MIGKSTKMVSAIFAVALMIMVAFAPVAAIIADDKGVDAAAGTVLSNLDVQLFANDSDIKELVYYGGYMNGATKVGFPAGLDSNDFMTFDDSTDYYRWKATGELLRYGEIPGYSYYAQFIAAQDFPMIQVTGSFSSAETNVISGDIQIKHDGIPAVGTEKSGERTIHISISTSAKTYGEKTGTREFLQNIRVGGTAATGGDLGVSAELQAGDYNGNITVSQGITTQSFAKTVNNGVAIVVSGKVTDAAGNAIKGATVTPNVNGTSSSALTTDKDGAYKFNVASGSTVSVAVAYSGKYTFSPSSYSFGTVTESKEFNFKANEYTLTIKVQDKSGLAVAGATVGGVWYYTKDNGNVTTVGSTDFGTKVGSIAFINSTTDSNGEVKMAYTVPVKNTDVTATVATYLYITTSGTVTGYTFATGGIDTNKTYSNQVLGNSAKLINITGAYSSVITTSAEEYSLTVDVKDKSGSNPIVGATVTPSWYYVKGTGNVTAVSLTDFSIVGTATALTTANADGKVIITYIVPVKREAVTDTVTTYLHVIASGTGLVGTFETSKISDATYSAQVLASSEKLVGISSSYSSSIVLNAKEDVFKITGNVEGVSKVSPTADAITYTYTTLSGTSANKKAAVSETGNYVIYVIKNDVISALTIDSTKIAGTFVPVSYQPGTIIADKVCDFKKAGTSPVDKTVTYTVTGVGAEKVTFAYNISGKDYTMVVTPASGKASMDVALKSTDTIKVTATANGYKITDFIGYSAAAIKINTVYVKTYSDITDATHFKVLGNVTLKYVVKESNITVATGNVTTAANGIGSFSYNGTYTSETITYYYGDIVVSAATTTPTDVSYSFGSYTKLDATVAKPISSEPVTVGVKYVSSVANATGTTGYTSIAPEITGVKVTIGDSMTFTAPSFNDYSFKCWMINGESVSDKTTYTFTATEDASTVSIVAVYGQNMSYPSEGGIDNMVLIIGIIAVIIALIAVAYVVIQKKD